MELAIVGKLANYATNEAQFKGNITLTFSITFCYNLMLANIDMQENVAVCHYFSL